MKRYAINYEETYSGTFTVELDDDSTEQDAINELLNNADEYRLGEQVELSDSDAQDSFTSRSTHQDRKCGGLTHDGHYGTGHGRCTRRFQSERLDCRRAEELELTK